VPEDGGGDLLILDDLDLGRGEPEHLHVVLHGDVEVFDGDGDVVEAPGAHARFLPRRGAGFEREVVAFAAFGASPFFGAG
jgi:hypothetical protein